MIHFKKNGICSYKLRANFIEKHYDEGILISEHEKVAYQKYLAIEKITKRNNGLEDFTE